MISDQGERVALPDIDPDRQALRRRELPRPTHVLLLRHPTDEPHEHPSHDNGRPSRTVRTGRGHEQVSGLQGALARDLLRDGLLDELHLTTTPVVAGRGRRLFDEPAGLLALELVESRLYPTGAVRLVLRPASRPLLRGLPGGRAGRAPEFCSAPIAGTRTVGPPL